MKPRNCFKPWSDGDAEALEQLVPLVYGELHPLARHYMSGERPGHSLQITELVNEAYLRLVDWKNVRWQNRASQLNRGKSQSLTRGHPEPRFGPRDQSFSFTLVVYQISLFP